MSAKKRKLKEKLLDKYRLVIVNDNTFEEKISFNLSRLSVFVFVGFSAIALVVLTTLLIAYTPLREYIPGYSSTALNKKATVLEKKTDSLKVVLTRQEKQINSVRKVLLGDFLSLEGEQVVDSISGQKFESVPTSEADSVLRAEVSREDKYNLLKNEAIKDFVFFPPVKGKITEKYNVEEKHFAVDIVVAEGTPVKSVADGTVIFAEWTAETGYVIIIEHANNLLSVYKHNASLNKNQGDLVQSGEVIAFSGAEGSLSTGPHLHFELWSDGYALDPTQFIAF